MRNKKIFYLLFSLIGIAFSACSYDEEVETTQVTIRLSEALEDVTVELRNTMGQEYATTTNVDGYAFINLPAGIYDVTASQSVDDGYQRVVYNGGKSDVVVSGSAMEITIAITNSTVMINNPILIKEIYVGGCQKDDGSGKFQMDKCIILYNNSSQPASLDNVAIGMIEPYNAEAGQHTFMQNGELVYENEGWVPAISGIWYFQPGQYIGAYSELVVNACGAIDNTQTYSNSINYANADYYCMYDVEATSSDGGKFNNTSYYPSPSELIPTSHYLKAVKYGLGNAWPLSTFSPAIIVFRTNETTPAEYGNNEANLVYPEDKQGNIVYACLKVPSEWILDAVEVFNAEKISTSQKRLTPALDNGYVAFTSGYGHSVVRNIESTVNGHNIFLDTNNSSNDFYEAEHCSLR